MLCMWTAVADALSKGKMKEVKADMPGAIDVSERGSKVLRRWINDPRVDRDLARRVLREVSPRVDVHIGRDYVLDMEDMLKEVEEGEYMLKDMEGRE